MDWSRHMRSIIERLGESVTWRPVSASAASTGVATVTALYAAPFARVLDIAPVNVPSLHVMTADVPDVAVGDWITLRGIEYRVVEPPESDPVSGVTICHLREAA